VFLGHVDLVGVAGGVSKSIPDSCFVSRLDAAKTSLHAPEPSLVEETSKDSELRGTPWKSGEPNSETETTL